MSEKKTESIPVSLERISKRLAEVSRGSLEEQSNEPLFDMARDKTLRDYAELQAACYEEGWLRLQSLVEDAPTNSIGRYEDVHGYHSNDEISIPAHAVVGFQIPYAQDGVDLELSIRIHMLGERPNKKGEGYNSRYSTDRQLHFRRYLSQVVGANEAQDFEQDIYFTKPSIDESLGVQTERVGIRKHVLSAKSRQEALMKRRIHLRKQLMEHTDYMYAEVKAGRPGESYEKAEQVTAAGVGRVDFEPERYSGYLPKWENRSDGAMMTHSVFHLPDDKVDFFTHMKNELPKYMPRRDTSYATMSQIIDMATSSSALPSLGHRVGIYDNDRAQLYDALDFMAEMEDEYRYPYARKQFATFPPN